VTSQLPPVDSTLPTVALEGPAPEPCVDCGVVDEWNFAVQHADGRVSVVCQEHGQDGFKGDEAL
jgi:hypothetical protein